MIYAIAGIVGVAYLAAWWMLWELENPQESTDRRAKS